MRCIFIDTETTGLDPRQGHRIIEIAAVEFVDRRATGRHMHVRIDPEREIDVGATEVHGLTWDDLRDRPKFRDVAAEFADFVRGADWIIHNAPFDTAFLDAELARADFAPCQHLAARIVDTLAMAREAFPGKRNNLDALCERFGVDNGRRTLHGALLDAQLLAEVWLAMTRGQESLTIDMAPPAYVPAADASGAMETAGARVALVVIAPTAEEADAHRAYLAALDREAKGRCVWLALQHVRIEAA